MRINSCGILGCGWLGLPLGKLLTEKGLMVKGSTTTFQNKEKIASAGITPYLIKTDENLDDEATKDFFETDVLIIAISPSKTGQSPDSYASAMEKLTRFRPKKVIFISSTSVYADLNREVTEADISSDQTANQAILAAERVWLNYSHEDVTIVRFGGLMGGSRIPGKYFAGKTNLKGAATPVNLIHQDDAVNIIYEIIKQQKWGEVFNAVADLHPVKKDLYTQNAELYEFRAPEFTEEVENYKIISNAYLKQSLDYKFIHPDPINFTYKD